MTKADKKAEGATRRDFLKLATTAAPAAAAAAVLAPDKAEATPDGKARAGLRDTEHTRAYYASARF